MYHLYHSSRSSHKQFSLLPCSLFFIKPSAKRPDGVALAHEGDGGAQVLLELGCVQTVDLHDLGARETVEERIARDIPAELPHLRPSRKSIPERQEARVGRHGETRAAVAEADTADQMLAHGGVARIVLGSAAVGHGDVAPETAVDVVHHAAKQRAVGRVVAELA